MIASPRSSSTATYIELQMQAIFFAKHLFQHRCHDLPKHLSLARANAMEGLDLSRDDCCYQQYILRECSVEVLVNIESLCSSERRA
jgi:hypothetical protein